MAEEATTTPAPEQTPPETTADGVAKDVPRVPFERFEAAKNEAAEAKSRIKEYEQRLEELEDRDRSETERATKRAERLERELAERTAEHEQITTRLRNVERGGWLRAAAQKAGFNDPEDAVTFAKADGSIDNIEDERQAERFIKKLAESKRHWLRDEQKTPQIGRVGEDGKTPRRAQTPDQAFAEQAGNVVWDAIQKAKQNQT